MFEFIKQLLSTHPDVHFLTATEEDEKNYGRLSFLYGDDEITILFADGKIYEINY